jgi:acetyl-CoA acetyltransferase
MTATAAIVGLGITDMGKIYDRSGADFAADAVTAAVADAGLRKSDIDGLLVNGNLWPESQPTLQMTLGLEDLTLCSAMTAAGSTAGQLVQYATMAIEHRLASAIVLLFADVPLKPNVGSGAAYNMLDFWPMTGMSGLRLAWGEFGANPSYALAARRHMHLFGTTSDHFAAIAIGQRQWALMNPKAQIRKPLSLEEYHASRWVVEPLHLFDCCVVSNGAIAVIVTSAERARDLRQPPVYLRGFGQCAPGDPARTEREPAVHTGAGKSGQLALAQAGIGLSDVDVLELYDCYTYTVLVTLEDYGFCEKGEGGPFVADGKLGPGGSLPCNTGGGQLSSYYMWGFTPPSEGVMQARGQAGERQVPAHDHVLVSGNGGVLNFHSTTILSPHER